MTWRRLVPLALAVTALLAVVALAARGRPLGANGTKNSGLPMTFWDYAFTTVVIVVAASAIVSLGLYFTLGRGGRELKDRSQLRTAVTIAILLAVCALVAYFARHIDFRHLFHLNNPGAVTSQTGPQHPHHGHGGGSVPPKASVAFQWPELVVVLGALLVLGVVLAMRSRMRSGVSMARKNAEKLAAALDESLDDLQDEPDLRRAIVAAYARMEAALGAAGFPRRPAEAPREYLERALLSLDTSAAAVRRLTDLFEWARFSHHEPEPAMRDEAIQSLADVRDELRANAGMPG